MSKTFLLLAIKDLISNPVKAWEKIYTDDKQVNVIRNGFLFPLIFLISVSALAGSLLYSNSKMPRAYSVFAGLECFVLFYFSIFATAYFLTQITTRFNLKNNFTVSFRLIVYSLVPLLICQVFSRLFESLMFINILSFFGLYIFYTGIEKFLNPPENKKMPLLIATFMTFIGTFIVSDYLLTKIFIKIYYAFFS